MVPKSILGLAIVFSLPMAFAQDFKKSFDLSAGGQIEIWNFHGDLKVTGYTGSSVEVTAYKKGPDRDVMEINDRSFGNRIVVFPAPKQFDRGNASVDFEVRVPSSIQYNFSRLSSFTGNVEVSNIIGRLRAESVRGNVEVKDVRGLVSASSVSGNVSVELDKDTGRNNMRFSSISGNIRVRAPSNLDAFVDMSSASGLLRTDFPIEVQEARYGPGRSARGRLGSGMQMLRISSVSGQVSLIQK
jgi:hypothetical protein